MDPGSGAFLFASPEHTIRSNLVKNSKDFSTLTLCLTTSSNVPELIDALWENTTVEEVCLLIHESFVEQPEREVLFLFSALGRLPQLKSIFFNTYRFNFSAILSIRSFTNVFRSNRRLVAFKLWRTELCVSFYNNDENITGPQQIADWAEALSRSRCLKEFQLIKCRISQELLCSDDTDIPSPLLDPILEALGKLSSLKTVEMSAAKPSAMGSLSGKGLSKLMLSRSLESLNLCNLDLSEDAAVAIAHGLIPEAPVDPQSASQQQSAIPFHCPTTSLIRHVRLAGAGSVASVFPKPVRDSFRTVLQSNYRLETLHLFNAHNLQNEISFYTKLNRYGRSLLMLEHHGSRKEWVETLAEVSDDVDCLFYFLGVNPLLCCGESR